MSDMQNVIVNTLTETTNTANEIVRKLNAKGDVGKMVHEIRNDTDNPRDEQIAKFQEFAAAITQRLLDAENAIDAHIKENYLSTDEVIDEAALKENYKTLRKQISDTLGFADLAPGVDKEAVTAAVPALLNLRGTAAGAGTGTGGKRPRIECIWIDRKAIGKETERPDGTKYMASNFTVAGQFLTKASGQKVDAKALQAAAFAAAQTDDLSELDGTVFEFHFECGEGDRRINPLITVQPQVPGSKAAQSTRTASEAVSEASEDGEDGPSEADLEAIEADDE